MAYCHMLSVTCTTYSVYSTMYIIQRSYTLYSSSILYIVQCTVMYTVLCTESTVQGTWLTQYTKRPSTFSSHYRCTTHTLQHVQCTPYIVRRPQYTIFVRTTTVRRKLLYIVHCTVYIVQCALYSVNYLHWPSSRIPLVNYVN